LIGPQPPDPCAYGVLLEEAAHWEALRPGKKRDDSSPDLQRKWGCVWPKEKDELHPIQVFASRRRCLLPTLPCAQRSRLRGASPLSEEFRPIVSR
jgi:hypothetical protein